MRSVTEGVGRRRRQCGCATCEEMDALYIPCTVVQYSSTHEVEISCTVLSNMHYSKKVCSTVQVCITVE